MLGVAAGAASIGCLALAPAGAEDTGRWEVLLGNAPAARYFPSTPRVSPAPDFRIVLPSAPVRIERPRSDTVGLPSSPLPRVAATPPDPSKRENPLQALLRDPTLRYGDIVMFPDGPRVFRGEAGRRHSVHDFVAVAKTRDLPQTSRKVLLAMPVGDNSAWSSDTSARTDKVARSGTDVETTGSLGKTVTVRTGRGDVRVIRVP
jgi:hypothetical protein